MKAQEMLADLHAIEARSYGLNRHITNDHGRDGFLDATHYTGEERTQIDDQCKRAIKHLKELRSNVWKTRGGPTIWDYIANFFRG